MQCTYFALPLDSGELQEHLAILGVLLIKIIEYSILNTTNTYTIVFSSWSRDRNTSFRKKS